jgi:hypothetical protein
MYDVMTVVTDTLDALVNAASSASASVPAAALAIIALSAFIGNQMIFAAGKQTRAGSHNGTSSIVRDEIVLRAPAPSPYHVFFLPGNPGLVEYYAGFLESLHRELNDGRSQPGPFSKFHVVGRSFPGFEIESDPSSKQQSRLYSLTEMVDVTLDELRKYVDRSLEESRTETPKIILAGHSFGTFALTEVMERLQLEQSTEKFQIIGGVLLFPPIADLDSSPKGSKIAVSSVYSFLLLYRSFC